MPTKLAVRLRPRRATVTAFERLRRCRRCGGFTMLTDDYCNACGARDRLSPFARFAAVRTRWLPAAEAAGAVLLVALAVVFARDTLELLAAALGGAIFLLLLFLLRRRYKPYVDSYRLNRLLVKETPAIRDGLRDDLQAAATDMEADRPLEAYEKLRDIGLLLRNDQVKAGKVACLNRFYIRKDMDLELEQVMPAAFSEPFVLYMWEAVKVNKALVRESVLDYVLANRYRIESMRDGPAILTAVAGAALRMKRYVQTYPHFFVEYLDELPRERFHRLCRLVADTPPEQRTRLYQKCKTAAETRYAHDPDFRGIF